MNAVTPTQKSTPVEVYVGQVLPPEKATDLFKSLPRHISPDRFERNLHNALMNNPDLMKADPRLVYREISKAVSLGLLLDPQLGEAYLIMAWNGKASRLEPQLRVGYRGLIKLGRQSGEITSIYAHEVCQNDFIECVLGDEKRLVHKPDLFGNRGPIVGYYAVVKYEGGETDFEPMTVAQVHEIRDRSDGWKAFKAEKIRSTPWSTDEVEMAKKTVIRRLVKRVPQSPELQEAIKIEDAAEAIIDGTAREIGRRTMEPPPAPRVTHAPAHNVVPLGRSAPDEVEMPDLPAELDRRPQQAARQTPVRPTDGQGSFSDERVPSGQAPNTETAAEPMGAAQDAGKVTTPANPASDLSESESSFDAEASLAELEEQLSTVTAPEHIEEIRALYVDDVEQYTRSQREKADYLFEQAEKRLAPKDPFVIPERFVDARGYAVFIMTAVNNTTDHVTAKRLQGAWNGSKAHREALKLGEGDLYKDLLAKVKAALAEYPQPAAQSPQDGPEPPPAPGQPPVADPPPAPAQADPFTPPEMHDENAYLAFIEEITAAATTPEHKERLDEVWKNNQLRLLAKVTPAMRKRCHSLVTTALANIKG
jgi:phage RecT family recombinase